MPAWRRRAQQSTDPLYLRADEFLGSNSTKELLPGTFIKPRVTQSTRAVTCGPAQRASNSTSGMRTHQHCLSCKHTHVHKRTHRHTQTHTDTHTEMHDHPAPSPAEGKESWTAALLGSFSSASEFERLTIEVILPTASLRPLRLQSGLELRAWGDFHSGGTPSSPATEGHWDWR